MVTVAVLGIIASIGIAAVGNVNDRSRDAMAKNLTETLNGATRLSNSLPSLPKISNGASHPLTARDSQQRKSALKI